MGEFLSGLTDAMRSAHRAAVLKVSAEDLLRCAERLRAQPEAEVGRTGIGASNSFTEGQKGWSIEKIE